MIATYRLQLHPQFTFADVRDLIPYFVELGVSHLYLSPITEARPGSMHGYDVIDHNAVRTELGGRPAFDRLVEASRESGLQIILDFVPNHAGVGPRNAYWQDVLAFGPHSSYASYFDIDWSPIKPELEGKILLPFLGRPYGEALDEGEIVLHYNDGRFYARYYDHLYALCPATYKVVLDEALPMFERSEPYWDLKDLVSAYRSLERHERDKADALRRRLMSLTARIDLGEPMAAVTGDRLHGLLEDQFWRLSYWKTAGYEINYRRFFDINDLVALRMEDDHVFWDAHQLLVELLTMDGVAGVRIDHVDGLFDPHDYLLRLRNAGASSVWVEKILAPGETLPPEWPVEGTTGYAFMNDVMGVLLDMEGQHDLEKTWRRIVGETRSFDDEVFESKLLVMGTSLNSELFRLSYELDRLSEADYHTRDFTLEALREALAEVVASFDRYRTYLPYDLEAAREVVQEAIYRARSRNPLAEPSVYEFVSQIIMGEVGLELNKARRAWVGRFQQYTAPVAAKGVEDTAFYRYLRLVALNEVGGEPGVFGKSLHAFHSHARFRSIRYPRNLLASATHDHKRGEDTRMRLIALAGNTELWDRTVRELADRTEPLCGDHGPSRADRYHFFQILAALWEDGDRSELADRLVDFMIKASRESKRQTSWTNPDEAYEADLEAFVRSATTADETAEIIRELVEALAADGFFNSLSQVVLKFTSPGIPDIYQGCEMLDLSLVDPDNRRAVDYAERKRILAEMKPLIEEPDAETLRSLIDARDPKAKFYFSTRLLRLRRDHPGAFEGEYTALEADSDQWITYTRWQDEAAFIAIIPRHPHHQRRHGTITLPDLLHHFEWAEGLTGARLKSRPEIETRDLPLPWAILISDSASSEDGSEDH